MEQFIEIEHKELLISRTDPRGVILAANDAFIRTSGFSGSELVGSPHKIVRHPDMPKGVFCFLWAELKSGNPVGAYVKNLAKSGRSYWVFAMISPLSDGYISIRMRASQEGIDAAESIYSELLRKEREHSLSPEESAAFIEPLLRANGYRNYNAFMSERFVIETNEREDQIGRKSAAHLQRLSSALSAWKSVMYLCDTINETHKRFEVTPLNMQVEASHLGDLGAALGTIATNFTGIASSINKEMNVYTSSANQVAGVLSNCLFQSFAQALMFEARGVVRNDQNFPNGELAVIQSQSDEYTLRAAGGLRGILEKLTSFIRSSARIKRHLSGLSVTRIMCSIEVARTGVDDRGNIRAMVDDLRQFEEETTKRMADIGDKLHDMEVDLLAVQKSKDTEHAIT